MRTAWWLIALLVGAVLLWWRWEPFRAAARSLLGRLDLSRSPRGIEAPTIESAERRPSVFDLVLGRDDADEAEDVALPASAGEPLDDVWCTVYSPETCRRGEAFLVQVFAHLLDERDLVRLEATRFDQRTTTRVRKLLRHGITRGEELTFLLTMPGTAIDPAVQTLRWCGEADAVQFAVTARDDQRPGTVLIGTVYVSGGSVPFGHVKFIVNIATQEEHPSEVQQENSFQRYHYAFVSYASADRVEVLKRVQMLPRLSIDFFHDLLSLEPGNRWEHTLYQEIDKCDVFLLFWSRHAKESPWVLKEVEHALKRKGADGSAPPEIVPIVIEGPPIVPPPPELKGLHFNDAFLYFMREDTDPA